MPISTLVQLTFYRYNDYWVKQRRKASNDIQSGVIWPPAIQIELIMSMDRSRDHIIVLFDSKKQIFQVNTPIKPGVVKEVRRAIKLNDRIYTCGT